MNIQQNSLVKRALLNKTNMNFRVLILFQRTSWCNEQINIAILAFDYLQTNHNRYGNNRPFHPW